MKKFIVANWKCNPLSIKEAEHLLKYILKNAKISKEKEVVICPPYLYLPKTYTILKKSKIKIGAQDCFWERGGAFTGAISCPMLKNFNIKWVIVGHSERKKFFSETNQTINKKIKAILQNGISPIFCIGENEKERRRGQTFKVLKKQIEEGLKNIGWKKEKDFLISYEPIWAIGTGKNCSFSDVFSVNLFIKKLLRDNKLKILYGGSVNEKNALDYIKIAKSDGLLIGGVSLKGKEFVNIINNL